MLTANLFSHFASDATQVARMVNTMSALLSATCILFLFWTITHLTRRLLISNWSELSMPKLIAIEASGLVGALIYTSPRADPPEEAQVAGAHGSLSWPCVGLPGPSTELKEDGRLLSSIPCLPRALEGPRIRSF